MDPFASEQSHSCTNVEWYACETLVHLNYLNLIDITRYYLQVPFVCNINWQSHQMVPG